MKKLIILSLILSFVVVTGCKKSTKDMLTGTWKLKSVEGETLKPEDLQNTLTFTAEGLLTTKSGTDSETAKWVLSADEKTIKAWSTKGTGDTLNWKIEKLDAKEFAFSMEGENKKITLEKQ